MDHPRGAVEEASSTTKTGTPVARSNHKEVKVLRMDSSDLQEGRRTPGKVRAPVVPLVGEVSGSNLGAIGGSSERVDFQRSARDSLEMPRRICFRKAPISLSGRR
jgi:hypothetical protein